MLGPEVEFDREGEPLGKRNHPLIERLLQFDAVVIAGQAKSHCVAWTIAGPALGPDSARARASQAKVYLLEDCTSPVVVPGRGRLHRRGRRGVPRASPSRAPTSSAPTTPTAGVARRRRRVGQPLAR